MSGIVSRCSSSSTSCPSSCSSRIEVIHRPLDRIHRRRNRRNSTTETTTTTTTTTTTSNPLPGRVRHRTGSRPCIRCHPYRTTRHRSNVGGTQPPITRPQRRCSTTRLPCRCSCCHHIIHKRSQQGNHRQEGRDRRMSRSSC